MKPGTKPTPTRLKILRGNPGKRPLNKAEPQPSVEIPDCPAYITGEAREQWDAVGPELLRVGVMTRLDGLALAMLATVVARWIKAEATVAEMGEVLTGAEGGCYQNPHLSVANKAWEQMSKMLVEFGMTPSSRSRVVTVPPAVQDEFDKQLERMGS